MANQGRSSGLGSIIKLTILIMGMAMVTVYAMDNFSGELRVRQEEAEREFQADLDNHYDLVTATILEKDVNEYDTGDWEYNDDGDQMWRTHHVTEYTYTIEYDYDGEHRTQTFKNGAVYPDPGSTIEIYVDKSSGEFVGDPEYVKK